jgi:hypothetical protein
MIYSTVQYPEVKLHAYVLLSIAEVRGITCHDCDRSNPDLRDDSIGVHTVVGRFRVSRTVCTSVPLCLTTST